MRSFVFAAALLAALPALAQETPRKGGTLTIALVDGGLAVKGRLLSTLRDQKKGKDLLNVDIPVDAQVRVSEVVIPLPPIR